MTPPTATQDNAAIAAKAAVSSQTPTIKPKAFKNTTANEYFNELTAPVEVLFGIAASSKVKVEILNPKKEAIAGLTLEYETAASSKAVASFRLPPGYGYKITIAGGSVEEATTVTCP